MEMAFPIPGWGQGTTCHEEKATAAEKTDGGNHYGIW